MKVYRTLEQVSGFGPCALTIGNFDGVHLGHRRILQRVVAIARERGWKPSALTFDPHPTRIVAPERAPRLLTSPERRVELMQDEGIEQVLILPFTHELAQWSPEEFVERLLVKRLDARGSGGGKLPFRPPPNRQHPDARRPGQAVWFPGRSRSGGPVPRPCHQ